jgi:hypothetical protein
VGTHAHLVGGFLPGGVQDTTTAGCDLLSGVHQEGRFANAGLTADQDEAAWHYAAAQDPVELAPGEDSAWRRLPGQLRQRHGTGAGE